MATATEYQPLITSFHITPLIFDQNKPEQSPSHVFVQPANASYLRAYGPIGTRDLWTSELLSRHAIPNYFSGCLTLTLQKRKEEGQGHVCVNDLSHSAYEAIRRSTSGRVVRTTHHYRLSFGFASRMHTAEGLLRLYASARCVVTSRLHCALPCLAFGTPVLFVPNDPNDHRYRSYLGLLRTCSPTDIVLRQVDFDFNAPSPNSDAYQPLRAMLIRQCREFTGWPPGGLQ